MKYPSYAEIKAHELLTNDQRKMCRIMRDIAISSQKPFTMLTFAKIVLRKTARDVILVDDDDTDRDLFLADIEHRKAAILFVYEALKTCEKRWPEWPEFDKMLKNLMTHAGEML